MKRLPIIILILILLTSTVYADPYRPYREGYIEGYLMEISQDEITIEEYDGTIHTLNIMKNAIFQIDGIPPPIPTLDPDWKSMENYKEGDLNP